MVRKPCTLALVASCLALHTATAAGDGSEAARLDPASAASRLMAITDVVLERHIDPPARQQMVLAAVKALYLADHRTALNEPGRRVSELSEPEVLERYLAEVFTEFAALPGAEAIATRAVFESIPGGANLVDAKEDVVQEQLRANRYVGTGIALATHNESRLPQISKVFYDGPAWKAGIRKDDLFVEIEGESTSGMDLSRVVELLRGEEGTDVAVVARQPDSEERRAITMTRGRVFIPTVQGSEEGPDGRWQYVLGSAQDMALVRVTNFGPSTLHELRQIEMQLQDENLRGIIVDLREGGGILHDVEMVADALLDGGVIGHVRSLDEYRTVEAGPGAMFQDQRMAVLLARSSNSACVFLSAALQDQGRAIVVGEANSEVPYVRSQVPIPGRGEKLVMATGMMHRGDGTPLYGMGRSMMLLPGFPTPEFYGRSDKPKTFIRPDYGVDTRAEGKPGEDKFVTTAIEALRRESRRPPARATSQRTSG